MSQGEAWLVLGAIVVIIGTLALLTVTCGVATVIHVMSKLLQRFKSE